MTMTISMEMSLIIDADRDDANSDPTDLSLIRLSLIVTQDEARSLLSLSLDTRPVQGLPCTRPG